MNVKILIFIFVWPFSVMAEGFSDLGSSADGFAKPKPNPTFSFPTDHGAHPEYRIEWFEYDYGLDRGSLEELKMVWTLEFSKIPPLRSKEFKRPFNNAMKRFPPYNLLK